MADYTLTAKLVADAKKFISGFKEATGSLDGLRRQTGQIGPNLQSLGGNINNLGNSLTSSLTKPAVAAATALAGITLVKGFNRLVGIDTAQAKLKALGHDAESVKEIMNSALDSVRGTAYGLDEAATTAASAVAAGVKPGQELTKYLSLTGDAAAIAGVSMGEMGSIFNKVETAQRAYTAELNQLADRGLPIYQWLAKEAGTTAEEIRDMASKGEISSQMFLEAVEKNIGGAAKVIGEESFTAAIANIWAAVGRIGANFLDAGGQAGGFFSTVKPMLTDFKERLELLEPIAADLGKKFGESFNNGIEKIKELKAQFDSLPPSIQENITKIAAVGPAILVSIGPALKIVGLLVSALGFILTPVGLVVAAIVGLGVAFGLAWSKSEEFREKVIGAFEKVKAFVKPVIDEIVTFANIQIKKLTDFWKANGDQILQAMKNVWNAIKAVIDFVMPAILFIIESVWNNIKGVISGVLNVIMGLVKTFSALLTGDFKGMWEGIKQVFFGAIEALWNAFNLLLYGRILKAGKALFTGLKTTFTAGWTAIKGQTTGAVNFLTGSFGNMVTAIRTAFTNVVSTIKSKWGESVKFLKNIDLKQIGKDIIAGLINGIKGMFSKVKGVITDLAKLVPSWAKDMLGIQSPSRVMRDEVGKWIGLGIAEGVERTQAANKATMNQLSQVIVNAAKSHQSTLAKIESESSKELISISKKAQEQIAEIHAKAKDGKRELTAAEVRKIAKIESDADEKLKQAKKKHADEIAKIESDASRNKLDSIKEFLDNKKKLEETSLIDEVNIWRKAADQFAAGTQEKIDAQIAYREALAKVNSEITSINETYANKMTEINNRLKEEELKLTQAYTDAVDKRSSSLLGFAGLFDEFAIKIEQSGTDLLSNLQTQVSGFKTWQEEIEKLSSRAIDDGLIAELSEMGPKALPQLIALNSLTDEQLAQYSALYQEKSALARTQAEKELVGMKEDTKKQIDELRKTANTELATLQSEWTAKIKGVTQATKTEFKTLTQIGKEAGQNLIDGLKSMEGSLVSTATAIAQAVNNALQATLGGSFTAPNVNVPKGKTASTPQLARGSDFWQGGLARMNEGGRGELVALPTGTQVIPHDISMRYAREAGRRTAAHNQSNYETNETNYNYGGVSFNVDLDQVKDLNKVMNLFKHLDQEFKSQ